MNYDPNKVGYGNPPQNTRFKKGTSGNPKGRPKKKEADIMETLDRELLKPMTVKVNGKRKRMATQEVLVLQLIEQAKASKNPAAIMKVIKFIAKYREDEANNWFKGMFNFAAKNNL